MKIIPTLNFCGRCAEAIHVYEKAFNGEIKYFLTYKEANDPEYADVIKEHGDYVYHSELHIGGEMINMCDNMLIPDAVCYSNFMNLIFDTKEEVLKAYDLLKEGSETILPMEETWYSPCRVSFADRFGIRWGLMTENPKNDDQKDK